MPSKYNGTLKTVSIIIGIVIGVTVIFGNFFESKADIKDTVDTVVTEEIADDNEKDDGKYYPKEDGVTLQANLENLDEDIKEIKAEIKEMKKQTNENYKLLVEINAKLGSGG